MACSIQNFVYRPRVPVVVERHVKILDEAACVTRYSKMEQGFDE